MSFKKCRIVSAQRESPIHSGRASFTAGKPYSQRERLIHSGSVLFTAGEPYSQRERLAHRGKQSCVRENAPFEARRPVPGAAHDPVRRTCAAARSGPAPQPISKHIRSRHSGVRGCHRRDAGATGPWATN